MPESVSSHPPRVPVPDLLHLQLHLLLDDVAVDELMEISFLGGGAADRLEEALATPRADADLGAPGSGAGWSPELFRDELFLDAFVEECFQVESFGRPFESLGERSMVLVDELCSGTNPSEAVEIFLMVIELLSRVEPVGLITTHFLDFARRLEQAPPSETLRFLQVEMQGETSTYQFVPGVASTSLAGATARRLGVTLDELVSLVDNRHQRGSRAR